MGMGMRPGLLYYWYCSSTSAQHSGEILIPIPGRRSWWAAGKAAPGWQVAVMVSEIDGGKTSSSSPPPLGSLLNYTPSIQLLLYIHFNLFKDHTHTCTFSVLFV